MNPFKPKTTDDSSPEDKSVIGRNSFWSAPKFSLRRYILIAGGLLVLAGGIVLLAASPSTVSPTNCFSSPGSCGYPDPAYHNVGATSTCSSLTSEPNGYTASTAGETVQNMNITGSLTIAAPNVTVNNVCVTASGNSGNMAVWVDSNATNLLLEHSTFAGASSSGNGVIDTGVWNAPNASGVTAEAIYITNAAEDWHGSGTLNDSYLQAGATFSNNEGISHNEDVYLSDTTFSANHDTLLNSTGQTAVLFGDNDGGGDNGPGDNHWTVTNSLWAGGGYTFYPQAGATSVGSSSMDIENNRISNAYYPNIGYYGFMYPGETPVPPHVSSDQLCAGAGTKWTGNVLDSNNATISCTGNIGAPGSGDGGGTTT
ncbi:MAG TPA: hypothetical protein VMR75_03285, partial [Candidatus Saccharimonadales bacterium]|nr:hypothetical protein [Candidatus Saccharimonadales bacterium]